MPEPERVGPYRLIRLLGKGGMGEVYLAHDERLDRQVALKLLRTSSVDPAQRRERFHREAKLAARLEHPAIVKIHDVLSEGELDGIVMEYVAGENLHQRIQAGPLDLHDALAIGRQIAQAMAEAHKQEIIHRDLKGENVLINRAGQVKITDFGIAKDLRDKDFTADGHILGTFRAMSPEQALGRPVDHRSDLFSFGVLLYEALTGVSPFRAETPYLTLQRVVNARPYPIQSLRPAVPAALAALIDQLLQQDPRLRPRDFHEVADTLSEIQGNVNGAPCPNAVTPIGPPIDTNGDTNGDTGSEPTGGTLTNQEPLATQSNGDAPAALALAATGTQTPAAMPSAMRDAALAPAAADPGTRSTQTMSAAPVPAPAAPAPAAPAPAAPAPDAESGDHAASAMVPSVRVMRPRRPMRRAAALAVTGAAIALALFLGAEPTERLHLAVPRPIIHAPAELPNRDLLAAAVRAAIVRGLLDIHDIAPLPLDDIDIVTEGFEREHGRQPLQHELATAVGAHELCAARLECTLQSCRVSLARLAGDGSTRATASFEVAPEDLRGSDQAVRIHLPRLYSDRRVDQKSAAPRIDLADHEEFLRLRAAYWGAAQPAPTSELIDRLDAIRARAQGAIDVHRFEAEVLQHRYVQTADVRSLARALEVIRAAEAEVPDSHALLISRFDIALQAGARQQAEDALRRIEMLDPGSGTTARLRGRWHAAIGEHEQAREFLQRAVDVDSSWRSLYHLASVESDLGLRDQAQAHIDQLLARSPGNYAALSLRANIEQRHGSPACALALYRELVARRPYYQECIQLGITEVMMDLHDDAARSFQCALKVRPGDARASFNLAEALKLAGDTGAATREFRRLRDDLHARGEPTSDGRMIEVQVLAHLAENDPALADQARALLQQMLADAPPSAPRRAQVLYRAAVVHALLGEHDRAAEHVRALLDRNYSAEWFRFPWFDGVRQDPALRQRLAYTPPARACDHASPRPPVR